MIKSWLSHQLKAKTRHGTHSPFVYSFLEDVLYDSKSYPSYKVLKDYKASFLNDSSVIEFEDLGAGSKKRKRKISQIAKVSAADLKQSKLLYRMAAYYKPEHLLEIGTNLGQGTASLALGNPKSKVWSIEGIPELSALAKERLTQHGINNLELVTGNFDDVLKGVLNSIPQLDFVYLDGNHRYVPTMRYFQMLIDHSHNDSIIILDDIHWSSEMERAWAEICNHPKVRVSIDLFRCGIVLLREEMAKEHFVIRF